MFSCNVSKDTVYGNSSSIGKWLRRVVFFALVLALTSYGIYLMYGVLLANGMTLLEFSILLLFSVTFAWISIAFCSASAGFVLNLLNLDPLSPGKRYREFSASNGLHTRTAVVMPVYNEETNRVIAGLEAVYNDLELTGDGRAFDFYLLSDTTDPEISAAEEAQFSGMKERSSGGSAGIYYRRRKSNKGRKAGNIADFCCRWGTYYDYMVVLDADSIMTGRTLTRLVRSMQANPDAGIIQTVPVPVRQRTVFGRFLQFASALYSPMISAGMCFWQAETSNYWGHNAIIRVKAFMDNCGLPELSGKPPLGGEILSHDFVEAALMRRGGWHTYMIPDLGGSYEEVPANILDYAKRDRRWVEGNLQHIRLLNAYGLHPLNRLYFALGALAYCSSLLWLIMLILSTVDAVARAVTKPVYFGSSYQLFPDWQVSRTDEIFSLLGIVVAMLIVPKIMGVVLCMTDKNKRTEFGGIPRLLLSSLAEMVFAVLVAPLMMCFHALFVISVLSGKNISWEPQNRDGTDISWDQAVRSTLYITVLSIIWGAVTAVLSPMFFWWLTPVLTGLVLSAPIVVLSSRKRAGDFLHRCGIFLTPSEVNTEYVLLIMSEKLRQKTDTCEIVSEHPLQHDLLPELHTEMPVQEIYKKQRYSGEQLPVKA